MNTHDPHDGNTGSGTPKAGEASENVEIALPLHHGHMSTIRLVAASLAADVGFSVDEIEDFRLGVDEAVSVMADVDSPPDARLHLRFELSAATIAVAIARSGVAAKVVNTDVDELAMRVLRAVVDSFVVREDGTLVVSKRSAAGHGD